MVCSHVNKPPLPIKNLTTVFFFTLLFASTTINYAQTAIKHFIFFSQVSEGIKNTDFYLNKGVIGVQMTYPWKVVEPNKNVYDFTAIEADLTFLRSKGKKLFIQIQDVTFNSTR